VRSPSLLPGWSVGHVLTHLARNADSHVRRLEAAADDRVVSQYAGGRAERDADIEEGAVRPLDEIVDDLTRACEGLQQVLVAFPQDLWDRAVVQREYFTAPAATLPFTRVMEVEVHHSDLGRNYDPADWSRAFTIRALPWVLDRLALRWADVAGPAASWQLQPSDAKGDWLIRRTSQGSTVNTDRATADCTISGPGHALVSWFVRSHRASTSVINESRHRRSANVAVG